ncbi:MAG: methylated-DNA--[protein]-cysteine S-methyltransferase [Comamonas sp.]
MKHDGSQQGAGWALFISRIGVGGIAWAEQGIVATQLPEADGAATGRRLLAVAQRRRPMVYEQVAQVVHWQSLPGPVLQAVAGMQVLLAGQQALPMPEAAGPGLLPDLRERFEGGVAEGLPALLDLPLDWEGVPELQRRVYALAQAIPPGQVRSYGELARELGDVGLSRAVGQALGLNPFAPIVPCHRILAAGGRSGGFSAGGGALTKLRMLELEGAAIGGTPSLFAEG